MTIQEAIMIFKTELETRSKGYYDYLANGGQGDCAEEAGLSALHLAIEALKLKERLMQEIPNFKEVISANYEMFMKYDVNDHTEIEQIAFDNFDKTVQDLQWLVGRLECDTE